MPMLKGCLYFSGTPDSSLWPSDFKDRFHVFGGCFHTGFHLTALVWLSHGLCYSCGKENGREKNKREKGMGAEDMERFLAYSFYYNQVL